MDTAPPDDDPRVEEILALFAREARIERSRLDPAARADQLGLTSLDVAMALFEIEDRYDIDLPEPPPGSPAPTVGELVREVIARIDAKAAGSPADQPAAAADRAPPAAVADAAPPAAADAPPSA